MPEWSRDYPLPPHAYVPGKTPRHPEDWFAQIKASVGPGTPPDKLHQTNAFAAGLDYLERGYFWECHEVLEAVWLRTEEPSAEREMVQAIIQLANARLKLVMHKPRASLRLCGMVLAHLDRCDADVAILGLHRTEVERWVAETRIATKSAL